MLYNNPLATADDLAGFRLEGDGAVSFPMGRLRLESTRSPDDGQDANVVLWCPENFPADIVVEWDFWPIREPGLCILFFHAAGRNGEDLFDLAPRTGPYEQYHHGDLDTYHVSYFRRRWPDERAFHTCNLRKSHGFQLVAQGPDPLPSVADAQGPYRMKLSVRRGLITFAVNDLVSFEWYDDHPLTGGKLGLRQMAPMIGEYANLRVTHA
ncbi:YesU family protein [Kribbella yunnanensis]|uniref:YesU family protein n=1 Tax=Kribbella yunnanensis TaxID=190194 RepID=A0ABP4SPE1_9ACTN